MDRKRNTKVRGRRTLRQQTVIIGQPRGLPQIKPDIIVQNHKFRYTASTAVASSITCNDILGAIGVIGTVVNTTAVYLARTFRIKRIEIWSPTSSSTTSATCSVNFLSSALLQTPSMEISDTSINVSQPAHIVCRPQKGAITSFWQQTSTDGLFFLSCPGGSVVDIDIEFILNDSTVITTVALAAVLLGGVYYLALNGPSTNTLVPVSMRTTA
jgi:hypothetical protein